MTAVGVNLSNVFSSIDGLIGSQTFPLSTPFTFSSNCAGQGACYENAQGASLWAYYGDQFSNFQQATDTTTFAEDAAAALEIHTGATGMITPVGAGSIPIPPYGIVQIWGQNFNGSNPPYWTISNTNYSTYAFVPWSQSVANGLSQACSKQGGTSSFSYYQSYGAYLGTSTSFNPSLYPAGNNISFVCDTNYFENTYNQGALSAFGAQTSSNVGLMTYYPP